MSWRRHWGFGVPALLALLALLVSACGGGGKQSVDTPAAGLATPAASEPVKPVETQAIQTPAAGTHAAATGTPAVAPATPTPTKRVQDVPCLIVPQEFCGNAEVIRYKSLKGDSLVMLGFRNLPAGTPIKGISEAYYVSSLTFAENATWKGAGAWVALDPEGKRTMRFIGDIGSARKGDVMTTIQGTGVKNFGYDLLMSSTIKENDRFIDNAALYETLFPGITSQPPVQALEQISEDVVLGDRYFPGFESPPPGSRE